MSIRIDVLRPLQNVHSDLQLRRNNNNDVEGNDESSLESTTDSTQTASRLLRASHAFLLYLSIGTKISHFWRKEIEDEV